jgi:DNA-binding beta-propeller fold protein YncE
VCVALAPSFHSNRLQSAECKQKPAPPSCNLLPTPHPHPQLTLSSNPRSCSVAMSIAAPVSCVSPSKASLLRPAHMQPPSVIMTLSSSEGRQLQRRLDVRVETSSFEARPAFLWAFQSSKRQLQAIFGQHPSLFHDTAAQNPGQGHALGSAFHFVAKQRQSLLTCSRLSVTLAVRFMCFRSACAVTHPLRQAARILSQRHELPGRLGAVAAAGAGFVRVIGSLGAGNGRFYLPHGVASDGEGNLVVSDHGNHRIQVFRYIDGAHLRTIGSEGAGDGQFNFPWGIAFDGAGHIIVSEYKGHRVQVLRYIDGAHVRTIGSRGSGNGQFDNPKGIAVDSEGNIAVYDSYNCRVQVLRLSDGACIRTIGSKGNGNGQFRGGSGGVAFDSEGNLVVADSDNHRVQVLRYSDGTHLRTIGSFGAGAGKFYNPSGVAFDAAGHIVVVDRDNHRVQVLRYSDGAHVRTIGSEGSDNGQFNFLQGGIAIDSDGRIVVADTFNHRVQVLE